MREVLFRVRRLAGRRGALALVAALAAAGCALLGLPLMSQPGYELAAGLTVLHGLAGAWVGFLFGRQERALDAPRAGWAVGASFLTLAITLAPPFLAATAWTWLRTPCDPFATVAFFPVLTLPTDLLVSAAGVFLGVATRRWWTAALLWAALVLASAAHTAWPLLFGPQVFAYDHLGGYLPGPLYDEELRVPASLGWFRLATGCLAAVFWCLAARRLAGPGPRPLAARGAALAAAALAFAGLEFAGVPLGFRMSDPALAAALGGRRELPHVVLHYPAELPAKEVERLGRDLEFRHAQVSAFLGGAPPGRVTVWWYRSAEEKQRLVGAAHTQFAKPWRREVHVNELPWPHPALKHELVHAIAAPFGAPPFGVTARLLGLSPNIGVVEGLAVAGDNPVDDLTLHSWAAAMRRRTLLPDVRALMEPAGFYAAPASRAYTTAGSFLRWLGETRGGERLRALYREGDFAGVYGAPLATLAADWEAFLDGVPLEAEAVNQALARFSRGSLFERPCAREVERLSGEARALGDQPERALERLARCRELQPEVPAHVLAHAALLQRLDRRDEARAELEALAARLADHPSTLAEVTLALAGLADAPERARPLLERVLALEASPTLDRTARVRLAALALPAPARAAVERYFSPGPDEVKLFALRDALDSAPGDPWLAYLLGRRLTQLDEGEEGLRFLGVTLAAAELPPSLRRETTRLAIEAAFRAGRCDRVRALVADAAPLGPTFLARVEDWVARCDFEGLPAGQ